MDYGGLWKEELAHRAVEVYLEWRRKICLDQVDDPNFDAITSKHFGKRPAHEAMLVCGSTSSESSNDAEYMSDD